MAKSKKTKNTEIHSLAYFTIQEGKTKAFKKLAAACISTAKKKDHGTIAYDWFYNKAGTECLVHEGYSSSDAFIEHMDNVGSLIAKMLKISAISSEVIGKPSKKLLKKLKGFDMEFYQFEQGF